MAGEGNAEDGRDLLVLPHGEEDGVVGLRGLGVAVEAGHERVGQPEQARGFAVAVPVRVVDDGDLLVFGRDAPDGDLFVAKVSLDKGAVDVGAPEALVGDDSAREVAEEAVAEAAVWFL